MKEKNQLFPMSGKFKKGKNYLFAFRMI
jgi:hypothetical protein